MTAPSMEDMNKAIIEDGLVHVFHTWSGHLRASVACALLRAHSLGWLSMLSGDEDSVDLLWLHRPVLFLQVLNGHLCLAIRSQPPQLSILAHLSQRVAQSCCHRVGQGHAVLRLITRISKHDTLVTGTKIHIVLANMDTSSNVWTLLVDAHNDLARLVA